MPGFNHPFAGDLKMHRLIISVAAINNTFVGAGLRVERDFALFKVDKCAYLRVTTLINGFFD